MQIAFDMYSGRPNPSWSLPLLLARRVFDLIGDSGLLSLASLLTYPTRLGYRGLEIALPVDFVQRYKVPPFIRLPADGVDHLALIRELLAIAPFVGFIGLEDFIRLIRTIIELLQKAAAGAGKGKGGPPPITPCAYEMLKFDPGPWNDPAYKPTNNCYAYASDKRAKYPSKPQPGVGSGKIYDAITGPAVAAAAKRDGAHDAGDCFPDSEAPRLLVALVIWPGNDYHWYRKHPDCWGHKPGSTDARNVDSSGKVITNPETCDRGPYSEFTGYMLIPKSQKVAA
jgi:hypothetical protein